MSILTLASQFQVLSSLNKSAKIWGGKKNLNFFQRAVKCCVYQGAVEKFLGISYWSCTTH